MGAIALATLPLPRVLSCLARRIDMFKVHCDVFHRQSLLDIMASLRSESLPGTLASRSLVRQPRKPCLEVASTFGYRRLYPHASSHPARVFSRITSHASTSGQYSPRCSTTSRAASLSVNSRSSKIVLFSKSYLIAYTDVSLRNLKPYVENTDTKYTVCKLTTNVQVPADGIHRLDVEIGIFRPAFHFSVCPP